MTDPAHDNRPYRIARAALTPMTLQEIKQVGDASEAQTLAHGDGDATTASTSSCVILQLKHGVSYACPIYLVSLASRTLQSVVEDLVEGAVDSDAVLPMPRGEGGAAARNAIPLPFVDEEVFITLALYWEHFYGVSGQTDERLGAAGAGAPKPRQTPSVLKAPLHVTDLYTLAEWEVAFVLQRLVQVSGLVDRRGSSRKGGHDRNPAVAAADPSEALRLCASYARNGTWADALGTPLAAVKPTRTPQRQTSDYEPFSELLLTLDERRAVLSRVLVTLEASTRLGVRGLAELCAALVANTVVHLDEEELGRVVGGAGAGGTAGTAGGGGGGALPAFTEQRKQYLLTKYPWADVRGAEALAAAAVAEPSSATTTKMGDKGPGVAEGPVVSPDEVETELLA